MCDFVEVPFDDLFVWQVLLKVNNNSLREVQNQLYSALTSIKEKLPNLVRDFIGPYIIFGQYDLFFAFKTNDLTKGDRLIYAILDTYIEQTQNLNPIRDFYKTVGFEWNHEFYPTLNQACSAYSYIKYDFTKTPHRRKQLSSQIILSELIKNIIQTNTKFRAFASLSWNELMIFFYEASLEQIFNIADNLNMLPEVARCTTNFTPHFENVSLNDLQLSYWVTSSFPKPHLLKHESLMSAPGRQGLLSNFRRTLNNAMLSTQISDSADIASYFHKILQNAPVPYSNTSINRQITQSNEIKSQFSELKQNDTKKPNFQLSYRKIKKRLARIEDQTIVKRKLMALSTQIKMLQAAPEVIGILPENLLQSIDFLMEQSQNIKDTTIQHYISEFTAAISERLAGTQLDILIGKDIGFLERHGSYQRLILACESLILRCLQIYFNEGPAGPFNRKPKPTLFVFFDYGARLSPDIPPEITSLGLHDNVPIVIRLRMLRYKPWLWATGLRELSKLLHAISTKKIAFELYDENPIIQEVGDAFIHQFFSLESFKRIIADELGYYIRCGEKSYKVRDDRLYKIRERYQSLSPRRKYLHHKYIIDEKVAMFSAKLQEGTMLFNMTDSEFINFINSYQCLPRDLQLSPKPFISFVSSLFWNHPLIAEVVNEKKAIF